MLSTGLGHHVSTDDFLPGHLVDNSPPMSTDSRNSGITVDKLMDNASRSNRLKNCPLSTVYFLSYKREEKNKKRNPLYTRARVDSVDTLGDGEIYGDHDYSCGAGLVHVPPGDVQGRLVVRGGEFDGNYRLANYRGDREVPGWRHLRSHRRHSRFLRRRTLPCLDRRPGRLSHQLHGLHVSGYRPRRPRHSSGRANPIALKQAGVGTHD